MSERWTCVTTNKLTFTQEPEANELLLAQVGDLCGKHSALVTTDAPHSCSHMLDPWRERAGSR